MKTRFQSAIFVRESLLLFVLLLANQLPDRANAQPPSGGRAALSLSSAGGALVQTSSTQWSLSKEGSVDLPNHTVTWTITATSTPTVGGKLVLEGVMELSNTGTIGATIGNIVVNLQSRSQHSWLTLSSDIADATSGDAATSAQVVAQASSENQSTFVENTASGPLQLTDASNNTVFSLVPEQIIAAGSTVDLLVLAVFDNNVLALPVGTPVRAEVIVSFGNAGKSGAASASNIDINGSGVIEPDEAWVRSVPARLGLTVPAELPADTVPTLSDTATDVTTTGTVTFSNPTFNLEATSGTVTVEFDGGTAGGTISNCAHLRASGDVVTVGGFTFNDVGGIDLQACDTQQIASAGTCTPGTPGCGWNAGDLVTYNQGVWGGDPSTDGGAILVENSFYTVYPTGFLILGSTFTMTFDNPDSILKYQPAVGLPGALTGSVLDPTSTSSGTFGGNVLALQLNVDFNDAGLLTGTASVRFGDLSVCGTSVTAVNGMSVRQVLALANSLLGGVTGTVAISDLDIILGELNGAFNGGVSTFAQQHLVNGTCP